LLPPVYWICRGNLLLPLFEIIEKIGYNLLFYKRSHLNAMNLQIPETYVLRNFTMLVKLKRFLIRLKKEAAYMVEGLVEMK
jgi:hypothetical protein